MSKILRLLNCGFEPARLQHTKVSQVGFSLVKDHRSIALYHIMIPSCGRRRERCQCYMTPSIRSIIYVCVR